MAAEPVSEFPVVSLKIGQTTIKVELAKTEAERTKGLMFRKSLNKNSGMLFDFGVPARVCMWMKNTVIPLSVAFIDQDGVIVNIEDMEPLTTHSHCSKEWVRYALEMNQGWFAKKKITSGSKVEGFPKPD
ncbi:MAG: DUF192 domain-containing protein [Betaproteobacteria bacterium]|nr:DUF192 domain-containing protein [Betaproteobacteria bacterium]